MSIQHITFLCKDGGKVTYPTSLVTSISDIPCGEEPLVETPFYCNEVADMFNLLLVSKSKVYAILNRSHDWNLFVDMITHFQIKKRYLGDVLVPITSFACIQYDLYIEEVCKEVNDIRLIDVLYYPAEAADCCMKILRSLGKK